MYRHATDTSSMYSYIKCSSEMKWANWSVCIAKTWLFASDNTSSVYTSIWKSWCDALYGTWDLLFVGVIWNTFYFWVVICIFTHRTECAPSRRKLSLGYHIPQFEQINDQHYVCYSTTVLRFVRYLLHKCNMKEKEKNLIHNSDSAGIRIVSHNRRQFMSNQVVV